MIFALKIYYIVFALLTIACGIIGFVNANSRASLIAGTVSGALLLLAAYLFPHRAVVALTIGLLVSVLLAGKFVPDFIHKKAPVPGGLMAVLSIVGLAFTLFTWYRR